jgi:hypothetical protein
MFINFTSIKRKSLILVHNSSQYLYLFINSCYYLFLIVSLVLLGIKSLQNVTTQMLMIIESYTIYGLQLYQQLKTQFQFLFADADKRPKSELHLVY